MFSSTSGFIHETGAFAAVTPLKDHWGTEGLEWHFLGSRLDSQARMSARWGAWDSPFFVSRATLSLR